MYRIKRFFGKIKKIFEYMPLLWRDEDWDYGYLLDLIKFKLIRMRDTISKNAIISNENIREISIGINQTIYHIDNYQNPDDSYEEIYGKFDFNIEHRGRKLDNGYYAMDTYNADKGEILTSDEEEKYSKFLRNKMEFEQDEWQLIFDTIKKEGQKWWD